MPVRLATAVVVVVLTMLATVATTSAQTAPTAGPTVPPTVVEGRPDTECISASPRPDCYRSKEFERSSRSQLLLFGVVGLALVVIATVVVRSTMRRDRPGAPPRHDPENALRPRR
jgi:hypothetical protein